MLPLPDGCFLVCRPVTHLREAAFTLTESGAKSCRLRRLGAETHGESHLAADDLPAPGDWSLCAMLAAMEKPGSASRHLTRTSRPGLRLALPACC